MEHWLKHRQVKEPVLVYYAGDTVFRYYLQLLGVEKEKPPYNWTKQEEYFQPQKPLYVIYRRWLRGRPAEELAGNVLGSLPDQEVPFRILFMHVHDHEDELMLSELLKTYQLDQ